MVKMSVFKATMNCLLCKEITSREEMVRTHYHRERVEQHEDLIPEMHHALVVSAVLATCSDFIRTKCCVPSIRKISLWGWGNTGRAV